MAKKKLTLKSDTVDYAIRRGLKEIGLNQNDVLIRVIQRDSQGFFSGPQEAVVAIIYDEEESKKAIQEKADKEFRKKFKFRFEELSAQVCLPGMFYDTRYYETDERREEFLTQFLLEKYIDQPDKDAIRQLSTNPQAQGNYVTVKTFEADDLNDRGDRIHLKVHPDNMRCQGIFFIEDNPTEKEIINYLVKKKIYRGVLINNIKEVLKTKYIGYFDLARGQYPVDDKPAPLDLFFDANEHKALSGIMEALIVDTRSVKDINIADRNQLLMCIGEVSTGKDGYTIQNITLRKRDIAPTATLTLGTNVSFSDDEREVYAKKAGHIVWRPEDNFIDIEPIYIVEGDVDYSEGNIIGFVGKVVIKGDVKPKFSVVAEGDIEVHGSVEDAIVESTTGNVFIGGSIIHQNEGYIQAKGNIHGMIATNAKLRANSITIEKEVMNSDLESTGDITITGSPGVFVGGIAKARTFIKANTIGSESWVPTKIHIGDVSDRKKRLRALNQQIGKQLSDLKEAKQIVKLLQERQMTQDLSDAQLEQLEAAQERAVQLEEDIEYDREEEDALKDEIESQKDAYLEVYKTLHPHVDLYIYEGYYLPPSSESRTGFRCREGLIVRFSLL
ncbi:MAG: hypothetical protein ACI9S8_002458 [Chlamydiales bacterium]|jgi:uncharacterized protein (DUF342 family)